MPWGFNLWLHSVWIQKNNSPPEIGRHYLFSFVRLFPCVPAHEISLVFVFWLEMGGGQNQITMARTAKIDQKLKF